MSIGGRTYGEPILAKHIDGHLEVFAFGTDGHLYRKAQAGPNQSFVSDWTPFSTNFRVVSYSEEVLFDPLTTRIAWAVHQNGTMYVFARTARGRIVFAHTGVPGGYSDWQSIGALQDGYPVMGNPSTASAPGSLDTILLCARARNGAVLYKSLGDSVDDWGDPNRWGDLGGIISSEPVVSKSRNGSTIVTNIYVRGLDNNLWWIGESVTATGSGAHGVPFGGWRQLFDDGFPGAKLGGHPVIVGPSGGVVWRGINGSLWSMNQRSFGEFSGHIDLHLPTASDPAITAFEGNVSMFWQSPDGQLMMRRQMASAGPGTPVSLTSGLRVRVVSKPSASTSVDGRAEVIFVGSDAAVYHLWETAFGSGTFQEGP